MTRYDKDASYIETFLMKEWDGNVPAYVRNSFSKSLIKISVLPAIGKL